MYTEKCVKCVHFGHLHSDIIGNPCERTGEYAGAFPCAFEQRKPRPMLLSRITFVEVKTYMKHPLLVRHIISTAASPKFIPAVTNFKSKASLRITVTW